MCQGIRYSSRYLPDVSRVMLLEVRCVWVCLGVASNTKVGLVLPPLSLCPWERCGLSFATFLLFPVSPSGCLAVNSLRGASVLSCFELLGSTLSSCGADSSFAVLCVSGGLSKGVVRCVTRAPVLVTLSGAGRIQSSITGTNS